MPGIGWRLNEIYKSRWNEEPKKTVPNRAIRLYNRQQRYSVEKGKNLGIGLSGTRFSTCCN